RRRRASAGQLRHSAGAARGLEVSLSSLFQDQLVERQFGDRTFEPPVLPLQLLQPAGLVELQTPILLASTKVGLLAHPQLPTDIDNRVAAAKLDLRLPQFADDLFNPVFLPGHLLLLSPILHSYDTTRIGFWGAGH